MASTEQNVTDVVRTIVGQQLKLAADGQALGADECLWDLGMTSLTCLGLMLNIEDEFEIELPESALHEATFRSVNTIVAAVRDAGGVRGESPAMT